MSSLTALRTRESEKQQLLLSLPPGTISFTMDTTMDQTDGPLGQNEPPKKSLLEQIRDKPLGMYRYHDDPFQGEPVESHTAKLVNPIGFERKQCIETVLEHRSEFPPKIQEALEWASSSSTTPNDEDAFFERFEEALAEYISGRDIHSSGLHRCTDSREHVELVIRFYPNVWQDHELLYHTYFLLQDDAAVSFIPVFVSLIKDVQKQMDRFVSLMNYLFVNGLEAHDGTPEKKPELAKKSIAVMKELKEMVTAWDVEVRGRDLMRQLCSKMTNTNISDFFEERLRLLIGWKPSLLKTSSLLSWGHFRVFEVVFELGLHHYPNELGFVFHTKNGCYGSDFSYVCQMFGTEKVAHVVYNGVMRHLGTFDTSSKLQAFVLKITSNSEMSHDGVYCLLRCADSLLIRSKSEAMQNNPQKRKTLSI